MKTRKAVTINSLKYDKSIRKSWSANLIERAEELLVFEGKFDAAIDHPDLGRIESGTISIEYYWLNCWYSIFQFYSPNGTFRNYYCNVNMPPVFTGTTLDYVDLDLDVLVWPDGHYAVLDAAEFEENARRYSYPELIRNNASIALEELISLIKSGGLPL